jgi:hypothetical protein
MPSVGFEPTISGSERAKTVHALDRSPSVTGLDNRYAYSIPSNLVMEFQKLLLNEDIGNRCPPEFTHLCIQRVWEM